MLQVKERNSCEIKKKIEKKSHKVLRIIKMIFL